MIVNTHTYVHIKENYEYVYVPICKDGTKYVVGNSHDKGLVYK